MCVNLDLAVSSPAEKKAGCKCGNRCGKHADSSGHGHGDVRGCAKRTPGPDQRVEAVSSAGQEPKPK